MKVKIDIDTKTFVRFWLVVIGFAAVILAIYVARAAFLILLTAAFLAIILNRPVNYLARRLPGRSRVGGTAIAYFLVVIILGLVVFLVIPPIAEQTSKFIDTAPALINDVSSQWRGLGALIDKYQLQPQIDSAIASIKANSAGWAANIGQNFMTGVGSALSAFTSMLLVLVLSFLMLVEAPVWTKRLWAVYDDTERMEYHKRLVSRMYHVVTNYVTGQITVSGIDGLCAGLAVFLLSVFFSVPASLALPAIAICFTLSLIPMFGASLAGIIMSLLIGLNDLTAGIIFAIYFMVYQQVENNLISPAVQAKHIELSPLSVLVAVTIGLYVFGVAGGIVSIPIAGCIKVLIEDRLARARTRRIKGQKPLGKLADKLQS